MTYLEEIRDVVDRAVVAKRFHARCLSDCRSQSYGADAVLFIAALLDAGLLRELRVQATELSLDSLVEVHTEQELAAAVEAGADIYRNQ